jgi:hypothetical protein
MDGRALSEPGALSPSTDACGIAGGASTIAILKKTVAGL